ncbi:pyrroline-5-carboxylate reductase [Phlyctema vagabunda]|uniref:Pyrroline-5-carboxylate reductase n=1 Tax=Phlyctema vagabunda TaxID=108571 RepID=A0ABR4PB35_9HELO
MASQKKSGLTLAIIGCGTMCTSILDGIITSTIKTENEGKEPSISSFIGTVISQSSVDRLNKRFPERLKVIQGDNVAAMEKADIIMLGCKPYMVEAVLGAQGVKEALTGKFLISVLVGTTPDKMDKCIYPSREDSAEMCYIRRAIPNLAASLGESATVVQDTGCRAEKHPLPERYQAVMDFIFTSIGKIHIVAEDIFDIAGILSGPGAVYASLALDGMLDGGVQQGLKRVEGKKILAQALKGLAAILEDGGHPAVLRENASSPRGVTIEGLLSLEEDRVRHAYSKAVIRATERSLNM